MFDWGAGLGCGMGKVLAEFRRRRVEIGEDFSVEEMVSGVEMVSERKWCQESEMVSAETVSGTCEKMCFEDGGAGISGEGR